MSAPKQKNAASFFMNVNKHVTNRNPRARAEGQEEFIAHNRTPCVNGLGKRIAHWFETPMER